MERQIIICGQVFDYADKAPFVTSGMSVLGAIEYDAESDLLRCHECGNWYGSLKSHVALGEHPITVKEYKQRHGLNLKSALLCFSMRKRQAEVARKHLLFVRKPIRKGNRLLATYQAHQRVTEAGKSLTRVVIRREMAETNNKKGLCQAQVAFRLQCLAADLGRTPTNREIQASGLNLATILRAFKMANTSELKTFLGMVPYTHNTRAFDNRMRLDERMPWPQEYFKVQSVESNSSLGRPA